MQIDMHYYGTYVLARAAGITANRAQVIASAAQFVDDNEDCGCMYFNDGGALFSEQTANGMVDKDNYCNECQRRVWVPFHFLPGCEGETYSQKLLCGKDSSTAQEMRNNHLSHADWECADELMGITAHVYADTFSHYGFSGISCDENKIINDSLEFGDEITEKTKEHIKKRDKHFEKKYGRKSSFGERLRSFLGEALSDSLGHGAVYTYPDRPYLSWKFDYEEGTLGGGWRDNKETYMEASRNLYDMFLNYKDSGSGIADRPAMDFSTMEEKLFEIIKFQGSKEERISQWINAVSSGFIGQEEQIPPYLGIRWNEQRAEVEGSNSDKLLNKPVYKFYQAASYHRQYVLRELLPKKGLLVA